MRRLMLTLAVAAAAAGSPLAADLALARDKGGRFEAPGERGRDRGPPPRFERGGPPERPYYDRPPARGFREPPPSARPRELRPGGYLPPAYRGAPVHDYARYRLRPPPHGYAWYRVGDRFLLVSLRDGQIFDVIVD